MLTENQKDLIIKCKKSGHGWRKFAESVEKQGFCSGRQEEKLIEMCQKINHMECVKNGNFRRKSRNYSNYCYDSDISDSEAYMSGDYF